MADRISTQFMFARGVDVMLKKQNELSNTELQLASGQRILKPSDDAAASVQILDLKEAQSRIAQYQRNAEAAMARLSQEETALDGVQNLLQRVRELAVAGNNDTLNADDRGAIAKEVRQHLDSLMQLANTQDANGDFVFAGFRTNAPPFSLSATGTLNYAGDQGQRVVQIGDSRKVAMNDPGTLFMNIPGAAGPATDMAAILDTLADNFEAGNRDNNALTDIDSALGRILNTRASIGARMNAIEEQQSANDSFDVAINQVRSSLEDLDYAEAISRFNQQLTALQASQQSFIKIQDLNLFNFLR